MAKKFKNMLAAGPDTGNTLEDAIVMGASGIGRENPIYWIPLSQIETNPYQPRLSEDAKHILGLAESIRSMKDELRDTMGLQQIPMARIGMMQDDVFVPLPIEILASRVQVEGALAAGAVAQLAFGHSRWWAFTVLARGVVEVFPALEGSVVGPDLDVDYASMPLRLAWLDDRSMSDHAATENAQRKNITPLEEAIALHRRVSELGMGQGEAGKPFGLSNVQVSNKLRLLRLPEDVQWKIQTGVLSETHGRALLQLVNAPHLIETVMANVAREHGGGMPGSRQLISAVERVIHYETEPLPDEVVVEGDDIDEEHDEGTVGMRWPVGWAPSVEDFALLDDVAAAESVHGACGDCPLRVQLGKEKFLRCTDKGCLSVKQQAWTELVKAAQIALMMERYGRDRVFAKETNEHRAFSQYMASPQLISSGTCAMEKCACMVLFYKDWWPEECERPHPNEAPNIVFACGDRQALVAKENALLQTEQPVEEMSDEERDRRELQLVREEQKRVNNDLANAAMQEVFGVLGSLDALFAHRGFLASLADALSVKSKRDWTVEELRLEILHKVLESNCREWVTYSGKVEGAGYFGYSENKLNYFVGRVTGKRSSVPKPAPVDAGTWQDGWDDADDREWLMIEGMGSQLVPDLVTRTRCALRLVDRSEDKGERAKWWKRYNELANPTKSVG